MLAVFPLLLRRFLPCEAPMPEPASTFVVRAKEGRLRFFRRRPDFVLQADMKLQLPAPVTP